MSTTPPALAVVIPVHGVEDYLGSCLDSILADVATGVEVVVVDDHSPDRSGTVAQEYAARDDRVRIVHLVTNVGLSRARNTGLAHVRAEYVWFVDGDDWLPPGSVPVVLARLAATRPDVLLVDHEEVFPDGRRTPGTPPGALRGVDRPGPLTRWPGLLSLPHSACTKVVRRSLLDEIDLRFTPGWYEDCAFSHLLLLAARDIDALDRVCYYYRQRDGEGITKSTSPRHFDVFAQYERVWREVDRAAGAYDRFRPELFRLMINHLLVIAGHEHRVPPDLRRAFFQEVAAAYRRWLPVGYEPPGGLTGLKHRLVRRNAYPVWAALRRAWRATRPVPDDHERLSGEAGRIRAHDRQSRRVAR